METSIDIPSELPGELVRNTPAETERQAVLVAAEGCNRRKRMADAVRVLGTFGDFMAPEGLCRMSTKS
jgi:hypothetical protein